MDNDTVLTIGLIGVGAYAAYKLLNNEGVTKTTSAIGDVAQTAGGFASDILSTGKSAFDVVKSPQSYQPVTAPSLNTTTGLFSTGVPILDTVSKYNPFSAPMNILTKAYTSAAGLFNTSKTDPYAGTISASYAPIPNVNYTPAPANFSSITGKEMYVPPPPQPTTSSRTAGNAASLMPVYTADGKIGSWRPAQTNETYIPSYPASTTSATATNTAVTGAKVGTIFASGAYVKSVGASGKYRTTI